MITGGWSAFSAANMMYPSGFLVVNFNANTFVILRVKKLLGIQQGFFFSCLNPVTPVFVSFISFPPFPVRTLDLMTSLSF
jgi:hypothetical protein